MKATIVHGGELKLIQLISNLDFFDLKRMQDILYIQLNHAKNKCIKDGF